MVDGPKKEGDCKYIYILERRTSDKGKKKER